MKALGYHRPASRPESLFPTPPVLEPTDAIVRGADQDRRDLVS